ncbi:MAG: CopD family protein [Longimicrobiales bacterium]|nr:CopD family protein [Longimicrobiales bacterium]
MTLYQLNVFVHVLAAVVWLGGMFFLGAVGAPVLRKVEPAKLRASLFREIGVQFRGLGWTAIVILVATGIVNLHYRGLLTGQVWSEWTFWSTGYGRILATKIFLVVAMIGVQGVHDFALGPAASRATPGSSTALRLRKWAAWLARVNTILGVVLIYVAVRLARGG